MHELGKLTISRVCGSALVNKSDPIGGSQIGPVYERPHAAGEATKLVDFALRP